MRAVRVGACTIGVLIVGIGAASGAGLRPDSGIHGLVVYGPTSPVCRTSHPCARPYQATITIRREPSGKIAARVRSGADGKFTVRLSAGRFLLQPHNGRPFPRAASKTVTVHSHHFTNVTIQFDSGIR